MTVRDGLNTSDPGTIVSVETAPISLRANPKLTVRGARGTHDRSDFLLVRVATSGGAIGYGEVSATLRWSGEDATTAEYAIKQVLAPAILGQPLHPVAALSARLDLALAGNPFTKAGLECALWDALGLRVGTAGRGPARRALPHRGAHQDARSRATATCWPGRSSERARSGSARTR